MVLRNFTTQVNEGSLQIFKDQMFVEVFGPEHIVDELMAMGLMKILQSYGVSPHLGCMTLRSNYKNLRPKKKKKMEANVGITSRACWRHNNQQGNQIA